MPRSLTRGLELLTALVLSTCEPEPPGDVMSVQLCALRDDENVTASRLEASRRVDIDAELFARVLANAREPDGIVVLKVHGLVLHVTLSDGRVALGRLFDFGPENYRELLGIDGRGIVQVAESDMLDWQMEAWRAILELRGQPGGERMLGARAAAADLIASADAAERVRRQRAEDDRGSGLEVQDAHVELSRLEDFDVNLRSPLGVARRPSVDFCVRRTARLRAAQHDAVPAPDEVSIEIWKFREVADGCWEIEGIRPKAP